MMKIKSPNNDIISSRTRFNWAAHSPDLNPLDFYLWGYLKNTVYANKPENINELKDAITRSMALITEDTCQSVIENFVKLINMCAKVHGKHFEQLL